MNFACTLRRVFLIGLCVPSGRAIAQMAELRPGVRVRIEAPGEIAGRLTGLVVARSADSLTVSQSDATPLTVAIAKVSTLQISRGKSRTRGALKGIIWAAPTGLAMGFTPIGDATCSGVPTRCVPVSRRSWVVTMVTGSVVIGAGVGALVGSERWVQAALPRVSLLPPTGEHSPGIVARWSVGGTRRDD